jgi:hypothetical protein
VKTYASKQGIALIDGPALLKLVQRARGEKFDAGVRREPRFGIALSELPICGACGGPMVLERDDAGSEFQSWYCSRSSACPHPQLV